MLLLYISGCIIMYFHLSRPFPQIPTNSLDIKFAQRGIAERPDFQNAAPRWTRRYFTCYRADSLVSFSVTERHNCWPSHGIRILHEALWERTASEERLSGRLGVDRASSFRLRHSRVPPGDGAVPTQAFVRLPGKLCPRKKWDCNGISASCRFLFCTAISVVF